ncbi:MAG: hypothetical protein JXQ99_08445 [Hyphomicrobiaceae bacterium]
MQAIATVNYHVASPEEQAFHIDADGESGKIVSPALVPTEILVRDARKDVEVSFADDSVSFITCATGVRDFDTSTDWHEAYNRDLQDMLAREIGAKETIVFDHTLRTDNPNSMRRPARNVHSDYSRQGAHQRLRDLLDEDKACGWESGHFAFINVWRPIENPINSAPLGFVRPGSVDAEDWLTIKLVYPDRFGSIMGLVANNAHEWIYLSKMTPDEIALFNIYDNHGKPSVAHSALDMVEDDTKDVVRKSIESRTLVRY